MAVYFQYITYFHIINLSNKLFLSIFKLRNISHVKHKKRRYLRNRTLRAALLHFKD